MRTIYFIIVVLILTIACNDSSLKINEEKLDKAGEKLQKTVQKGADSVEAKLKRLKNKADKD